jgi:hypothetical protein
MKDVFSIDRHQDLIKFIALLPEVSGMILWQVEQLRYIQEQRNFWTTVAHRIDYLQRIQLGFSLTDPIDYIEEPILKIKLKVYSDFYFQSLQVIIDGFDVIKAYTSKQERNFPFHHPRELLAAICRQTAEYRVEEATSPDLSVGMTATEARQITSDMGKFYRGALEEEVIDKLCAWFEGDEGEEDLWWGLTIAALYRVVGIKRLQKWNSWKDFLKAYKSYQRYLNDKRTFTIRWNTGVPVFSATDSPVYPPIRGLPINTLMTIS